MSATVSSLNPYRSPDAGLYLQLEAFDPARHGLLRVRRGTQFADMTRRYRIEVDGQPRAAVRQRSTADVPLEPGSHQLVMRLDWFSSPVVDFHIRAGEMCTFDCWSNIRGWRIWLSGFYAFYYLVRRNEYLGARFMNAEPAVVATRY